MTGVSNVPHPAFVVFDGDGYSYHTSLEEARKELVDCIEIARKECDPYWPSHVEEMGAYYVKEAVEDPDQVKEQPRVLTVTEIELDGDLGDDSDDYYADYVVEDGPDGVPE